MKSTTLKIYPIFYGKWTATQITIVTNFLSGLGGSSWWNINAQYSDTAGTNTNTKGLYAGKYLQYNTTTVGTSLTLAQVRMLVHCQ